MIVDRELAIQFIKKKIERLKKELDYYETILNILTNGNGEGWKFPEKYEEVKVGRKKIGIVYWSDNYVRARPLIFVPMIDEVKFYLTETEKNLREMQVRIQERYNNGDGNYPLATLKILTDNQGNVSEIVFENLNSPVERVRAKGSLKHALESLYEFYNARRRSGNGSGEEA